MGRTSSRSVGLSTSTISIYAWRRGGDSNPRYLLGTHAFQACSLSHSDTSPGAQRIAKQSGAFLGQTAEGLPGVDAVVVAIGPVDLEGVGADAPVRHGLEGGGRVGALLALVDVAEHVGLPLAHRARAVAPQLLQRDVVLPPVLPDDRQLPAHHHHVLWNRDGHRQSKIPNPKSKTCPPK